MCQPLFSKFCNCSQSKQRHFACFAIVGRAECKNAWALWELTESNMPLFARHVANEFEDTILQTFCDGCEFDEWHIGSMNTAHRFAIKIDKPQWCQEQFRMRIYT